MTVMHYFSFLIKIITFNQRIKWFKSCYSNKVILTMFASSLNCTLAGVQCSRKVKYRARSADLWSPTAFSQVCIIFWVTKNLRQIPSLNEQDSEFLLVAATEIDFRVKTWLRKSGHSLSLRWWRDSTSCHCSSSAACLLRIRIYFLGFVKTNTVFSNSWVNPNDTVQLFECHTQFEANTHTLSDLTGIWSEKVEPDYSVIVCPVD